MILVNNISPENLNDEETTELRTRTADAAIAVRRDVGESFAGGYMAERSPGNVTYCRCVYLFIFCS